MHVFPRFMPRLRHDKRRDPGMEVAFDEPLLDFSRTRTFLM